MDTYQIRNMAVNDVWVVSRALEAQMVQVQVVIPLKLQERFRDSFSTLPEQTSRSLSSLRTRNQRVVEPILRQTRLVFRNPRQTLARNISEIRNRMASGSNQNRSCFCEIRNAIGCFREIDVVLLTFDFFAGICGLCHEVCSMPL